MCRFRGPLLPPQLCRASYSVCRLVHQWYPRLIVFAATKRQAHPFPSEHALSDLDLAVRRIVASKVPIAKDVPARPFRLGHHFYCSLGCSGGRSIRMAGLMPKCVFLTPDELREWDEVYSHPAIGVLVVLLSVVECRLRSPPTNTLAFGRSSPRSRRRDTLARDPRASLGLSRPAERTRNYGPGDGQSERFLKTRGLLRFVLTPGKVSIAVHFRRKTRLISSIAAPRCSTSAGVL